MMKSRGPTVEAVQAALNRIDACKHFASAPRLKAFLRFVVNARLDGRSGTIKAYTVAVEALGRPGTFDPMTDASVRVEASRLRTALARYYDGEGLEDPVVISLPRGTYIPEIRWRDADVDTGGQMQEDEGSLMLAGLFLQSGVRTNEPHALHAQCDQIRAKITALREELATLEASLAGSRPLASLSDEEADA